MNQEQYVAYHDILSGHNVLLSSAGGTGKTYVLEKVIEELTKRGKRFQVTSTSARTAILLGGLTIHRFLRITPACQTLEDYIKDFRTKRTAQIFKNLDVLIIDEIGLITNDFFHLVYDIFTFERATGWPFGGVQVVFAGDLLQLSSIQKEENQQEVFELEKWKNLQLQVHVFQKVIRQSDDSFVCVLNKIRIGNCATSEVQKMLEKACAAIPDPRYKYIELYARNVDKEEANANYLETVDGTIRTFTATDKIFEDGSLRDIDSIGEKQLELKRGIMVMLLRNMVPPHEMLTNGTLGEIVGYSYEKYPLVRFSDKLTLEVKPFEWQVFKRNASGQMKVVASRKQVPLTVAHAFSYHKVQGLTLDRVILDCKGMFAEGQFYTGMSRVKTLDGVVLRNFHPTCIKTNWKAVQFYEENKMPTDR